MQAWVVYDKNSKTYRPKEKNLNWTTNIEMAKVYWKEASAKAVASQENSYSRLSYRMDEKDSTPVEVEYTIKLKD